MIGSSRDQLPDHQRDQAERRRAGKGDDHVRAEPVVALAFVEHEFERAEPDRDQREADVVDAQSLAEQLPPLLFGAGGLVDQRADQKQRDQSHRHVDQEDPVPGIVVGDPAAERRPDHRRDHDRDAVDRKGLAALFGRKRVGEDRLLAGRHAAAAEALQDAEQHQRLQIPGEAAQQRGEREGRDADHVEALAADHRRQPARDRQHDGVGDEIAGDDVGALVDADREAAGDMAQRDIGDGGVEHLHEGRDRDDEGDQIGIVPAGRGAFRRPAASMPSTVAHRTLVQGTTDMPGPTGTSSGQWSTTIFTGTRCTTLT